MKLSQCSGLPEIFGQLEEGVGVVVYYQIAGGGGVNMPWVYMLSAIYETYVV